MRGWSWDALDMYAPPVYSFVWVPISAICLSSLLLVMELNQSVVVSVMVKLLL